VNEEPKSLVRIGVLGFGPKGAKTAKTPKTKSDAHTLKQSLKAEFPKIQFQKFSV
jgi:hypothetical protein